MDKKLKEDVFKMLQKTWGKKSEIDLRNMLNTIDETFKRRFINLMSIFSIESAYQTSELDQAILFALLKAQNSVLKSKEKVRRTLIFSLLSNKFFKF